MNELTNSMMSGVLLTQFSFCGVYKVVCQKNNRSYIGQSLDVVGRAAGHARALDRNTHSNKELQSDYNLYGPDFFIFMILEQTEELDEREAYHIARVVLVGEELVYNIVRKTDGHMVTPVARAIEEIQLNHIMTCPNCGCDIESD